jgi:hypothetical protein
MRQAKPLAPSGIQATALFLMKLRTIGGHRFSPKTENFWNSASYRSPINKDQEGLNLLLVLLLVFSKFNIVYVFFVAWQTVLWISSVFCGGIKHCNGLLLC